MIEKYGRERERESWGGGGKEKNRKEDVGGNSSLRHITSKSNYDFGDQFQSFQQTSFRLSKNRINEMDELKSCKCHPKHWGVSSGRGGRGQAQGLNMTHQGQSHGL